MKYVITTLLFLAVCAIRADVAEDLEIQRTHLTKYEAAQSPSRMFIALSGVGLADVSPSIRMRVRILVVTLEPLQIRQLLPWVHPPYVVVWAENDVLLACGLDEERRAFEISAHQFSFDGKVVHRNATDSEKTLVVAEFEKKNGKRPTPLSDMEQPNAADDFPTSAKGTSIN